MWPYISIGLLKLYHRRSGVRGAECQFAGLGTHCAAFAVVCTGSRIYGKVGCEVITVEVRKSLAHFHFGFHLHFGSSPKSHIQKPLCLHYT
jgi:hypothetical protein